MIDAGGAAASNPYLFRARDEMLHDHLRARGISDARVLEAFATIPRELFVPTAVHEHAYDDNPLDIGLGQTISQPYIVARMTQLLKLSGRERVLEIGTGSGYQTALLARLAGEVYSIERHPPLLDEAAARLKQLGLKNVSLRAGDGSRGWPEAAPFDRILVTCAVPRIPAALMLQLIDGGWLVAPVGMIDQQRLTILERRGNEWRHAYSDDCRFVPLIGQDGFSSDSSAEANRQDGPRR